MTHATAKRKANEALHDLTLNRYFQSVPLDTLFATVEAQGFEIPEGERAMLVCGHEGRAIVPLTRTDPSATAYVRAVEALDGRARQPRAFDGGLTFTWYRMPSGNFEIVAYVS